MPLFSGMVGAVRMWFQRQIADVPADLAVCEYDCEKLNCSREEFDACERRMPFQEAAERAIAPDGTAAPAPVQQGAPSPATAVDRVA